MIRRWPFAVGLLLLALAGGASAYYRVGSSGAEMTSAAEKYVGLLTDEQKAKALLPYDSPKRVDWHFIPKNDRKGLQLRDMTEPQRTAALALVRAALSQLGYDKASKIISLENLLHDLEKTKKGAPLRDPQRYYVTVFGKPAGETRWGLSFEGHHLSLNFVVEGNKIISSTPEVFATNPATLKSTVDGAPPAGTRILEQEEELGFTLVNSLSPEQLKAAMIAEKAPAEVRAAGAPQPPTDAPAGLPAEKLTAEQKKVLRALVNEYCRNLPEEVGAERWSKIEEAGFDKIYFAYAGATKAGVGNYYRVEGPTFVIELVNTQPDAAGNPANHVHCLWRDKAGDFAIPVTK